MSPFRLCLWREWREHRMALLAILLLLPACAWFLCLPLPRAQLGDPLFHAATALGFALVGLVAIGGELLGGERRGSGARWLERLPAGLGGAFRAKLVFLALTLVLTTAFGYGVGRGLGALRGAQALKERQLEELLGFLAALVLVLGTWTFALSAWALRGGLALMAATLVLAVLGLPAWRVLEAGYDPRPEEAARLAAVLVATGLLAAWLGFVRGARLGRGVGASAFLGLSPAAPVLLGLFLWSEDKLAERDAFDPGAASFRLLSTRVTADGRQAFGVGTHALPRWGRGTMPLFALRIDLADGSHEALGRVTGESVRFRPAERGLLELEGFVLARKGLDPLVFDAATGAPGTWSPSQPDRQEWKPRGLGIERFPGNGSARTLWDPFRQRAYPVAILGERWYAGKLLVRPGPWLLSHSPMSWTWFDPDAGTRVPTGWPAHAEPLVLLEDGRILLADPAGLRWIHPERGTSERVECGGLTSAQVTPNENGKRIPSRWRDALEPAGPTIVLHTRADGWLVLADGEREACLVPVADQVRFLELLGPDTALVQPSFQRGLARLDLASGALTPLWPRPAAP